MVAGALKNPWGFLRPAVRLDELFLSAPGGWPGGREVESHFGDSSGLPCGHPAVDPDEDSESEYLYVEELPAPAEREMAEVRLDFVAAKTIKRNRGVSCFVPRRVPAG